MVHVCDISDVQRDNLVKELPGIGFTQADVALPSDVNRLFQDLTSRLGGLDILINNAGIAGPTAAVENISPEEWSRTLAVNITGQFLCVRMAVPMLKKAGGGSIVNISSVAGRLGYPMRTPYAASKWAVQPAIRAALLERQRDFATAPGLIADGRDMGTVIFPDADLKLYITASPEERARRRFAQLSGQDVDANLDRIYREILERDARDASREVAPLKPADDAHVIDTTGESVAASLAKVRGLVREKGWI